MKRAVLGQLEAALRADGRRDPPAFSLPLHRRIMEALGRQGLPREAPRAAGSSRRWVIGRIGMTLALAAGVAVAAWIVFKPAPSPRSPVKEQVALPKLPVPVLPAAPAPDATIEQAKYAYLDRDARKLWMFVADQIPELPAPPK